MAQHHILLTFDVEDWFQVENLRPWNPPSTWHERELRVEESTRRILDLLDSMAASLSPSGPSSAPSSNSRHSLSSTFFVLGWVARRCPGLVREISSRGHEVASHGDSHLLCTDMNRAELEQDLTRSKAQLEDLIGEEVTGYRAPSFSVNETVLERIRGAGYRYDSSYNSFALHPRYGRVELPAPLKGNGIAMEVRQGFFELPISNLRLLNRVIPWGGGGYFRLIPSFLFIPGVRRIVHTEGAYVLYLHPWEFDPDQPRVKEVSWQYGFRHYVNLDKTEAKLERLTKSFARCRFATCTDYLRLPAALEPRRRREEGVRRS